ncbi:hypothetical protein [Teredinibacter turnerae]|uniref:hypothetical protein n=1 Tax=Teredinibacter turnerae TaxID=2426 RepID=UPI0005F7A8D4|nr:hypothetical protein [Teredinibacter turnerae]
MGGRVGLHKLGLLFWCWGAISIFLVLSCTGESSAAKASEKTNSRVSLEPDRAPVEVKLGAKEFTNFFGFFCDSIVEKKWDAIKGVTQFPFMLRGELDDEGELTIKSDDFTKVFSSLLAEETYLLDNDEIVATTYKIALLQARDTESLSAVSDRVNLNGFEFQKIDGEWKFVRLVTYLHVMEKYREVHNESIEIGRAQQ